VRDHELAKDWLVVTRRRTGVYLATFDPRYGGMHVSYHNDGAVNMRAPKIPGPDIPTSKHTPLSEITTYVVFPMASMPLTAEQFERLPDADLKRFDYQIVIERREIVQRLSCRLYLFRPGCEDRLPGPFGEKLLVERRFRHTAPWIGVQLLVRNS
jgi:hypothetical protein